MDVNSPRQAGDPVVWGMYASAGPEGSDEPLRFFGPLGYAQRDTTAKRVVKVLLTPTDDPAPQDYWAWLDTDAWAPCHIAATEQEMTFGFRAGSDPEGPRDYEARGQGQILRLKVTILPEEVYLRSGRSNWRITSAM